MSKNTKLPAHEAVGNMIERFAQESIAISKDERRAVRVAEFGELVLSILQDYEEWDADTLDAIYEEAFRLKLAESDGDDGGMFKVVGGKRA